VVHCFTYETGRGGDSEARPSFGRGETGKLSDTEVIWETFDSLFKTVHRQGRRVEELEAWVVELEGRRRERSALAAPQPRALEQFPEMPSEKAA
jgi:hypothetical protein